MDKSHVLQYYISEYSTSKNPAYAFLFAPCRNADTHIHCDFYEFSLITRGSFINDYKGQQELLPKDTLIFFRKEETHAMLKDAPMSIHFSLLIESDYFEEQFAMFFPKTPLSSLGNYCNCHLQESQSRFLQDIAIKLCNNENKKYQDQLVYLFMMTALTNLIIPSQATVPKQVNFGNSAHHYATELLDRLDNYMYIADPVNEIYKDFPINKVALIQAFKERTGETIIQYSNKKKMEYAAQLLSIEKQSVADIANVLNFSSPSHFTKVFNAHFGMNPKKYQQMNSSHCKKHYMTSIL